MAVDQSTLSPLAREGYIHLGKSFSSIDTLAQANLTLKGLALHGRELIRHGFGPSDAQRLTEARDALQTERVGRGAEVGEKLVSREAVRDALARAGGERFAARSILSGAARELLESGDAEGARKIEVALQQTSVVPARDAGLFADQLEHLHGALVDPALAPAAADRGGPEAVVDLETTIATLRSADRGYTGIRGTPVATERLDLLDGIVVTLARRAFRAAHAAGRRLGKPALAAAFDLKHVRKSRARPDDTPSPAPKPPAPGPKSSEPGARSSAPGARIEAALSAPFSVREARPEAAPSAPFSVRGARPQAAPLA